MEKLRSKVRECPGKMDTVNECEMMKNSADGFGRPGYACGKKYK
jgi:hypothetical protein